MLKLEGQLQPNTLHFNNDLVTYVTQLSIQSVELVHSR